MWAHVPPPPPTLSFLGMLFGGHPHENVYRFMEMVNDFKKSEGIDDDLAMRQMRQLLYGPALEWWKEQMKNNKTFRNWDCATCMFKYQFKRD